LYEALEWAVVRAPLLPVAAYAGLASETRQASLIADSRVRRAFAVGSSSLLGAIERHETSALTHRDADRLRSRMLRYLIRMSRRPTPYGLFAGVALARVGPVTNLPIASTCAATRTRPDMAWLMDLVLSAEKNPSIRRRLRLRANPLAMVRGGRASLPHSAPTGSLAPGPPVSIRATPVVVRALEMASQLRGRISVVRSSRA
jgi:hypothetical protein